MTRRKRRATDLCHCGHDYDDHTWGFRDESEPCDIAYCGCRSFLADGLPADPDRDDRQHVHAAGCDHDIPAYRDC